MAYRVLVVEDEPALAMGLADLLAGEGYRVTSAADGNSGLEQALRGDFDVIILDVMLPGRSGLEVCSALRAQSRRNPVLMLTARGTTMDKVLGLKIGADDYLTKPFDNLELLARVEALIRRSHSSPEESRTIFSFGALRIDLLSTEVTNGGERVDLSAREFQLLRYLLQHRGQTLSRQRLLTEVWGFDAEALSRTVDIHMARLRKKLEPDVRRPQLIVTVQGLGYKFTG